MKVRSSDRKHRPRPAIPGNSADIRGHPVADARSEEKYGHGDTPDHHNPAENRNEDRPEPRPPDSSAPTRCSRTLSARHLARGIGPARARVRRNDVWRNGTSMGHRVMYLTTASRSAGVGLSAL